MRTTPHFRLAGACVCVWCGVLAAPADIVAWTDGRVWEGKVELGDAAMVRLHDGKQVRSWPLHEVAEIRFLPATQEMERAWVFREAGKTAKEYSGEPYPVMELRATVGLRNGEQAEGHLLTTVFYLTGSNRTEKLVLKFKLRGREGETYSNLVYAARIGLSAPAGAAATNGPGSHATIRLAGAGPGAELALVSRQRMQEAEAKAAGGGAFRVTLDGGDIVPAVREGDRIRVGWTGEVSAVARSRLERGLRDLRDFFDDRTLLAAAQDPADETTCHTLLLLARRGRTTLDGAKTQPWRLEVWKWRLGSDTNDITAAARCVLFRGLLAPDAPRPVIVFDAGLRPLRVLEAEMTLRCQEK